MSSSSQQISPGLTPLPSVSRSSTVPSPNLSTSGSPLSSSSPVGISSSSRSPTTLRADELSPLPSLGSNLRTSTASVNPSEGPTMLSTTAGGSYGNYSNGSYNSNGGLTASRNGSYTSNGNGSNDSYSNGSYSNGSRSNGSSGSYSNGSRNGSRSNGSYSNGSRNGSYSNGSRNGSYSNGSRTVRHEGGYSPKDIVNDHFNDTDNLTTRGGSSRSRSGSVTYDSVSSTQGPGYSSASREHVDVSGEYVAVRERGHGLHGDADLDNHHHDKVDTLYYVQQDGTKDCGIPDTVLPSHDIRECQKCEPGYDALSHKQHDHHDDVMKADKNVWGSGYFWAFIIGAIIAIIIIAIIAGGNWNKFHNDNNGSWNGGGVAWAIIGIILLLLIAWATYRAFCKAPSSQKRWIGLAYLLMLVIGIIVYAVFFAGDGSNNAGNTAAAFWLALLWILVVLWLLWSVWGYDNFAPWLLVVFLIFIIFQAIWIYNYSSNDTHN